MTGSLLCDEMVQAVIVQCHRGNITQLSLLQVGQTDGHCLRVVSMTAAF